MTVEIELKFVATPAALAALPEALSGLKVQHNETLNLINVYYDTDAGLLRSYRFGLRVRGCNDNHEMTLKSGGKVVNGIVHRPEYNIPLPDSDLNIDLFPPDVWPQGTDISALKSALKPLFTTNFQRQIWLVNYQQSQIEIALDHGSISAGEQTEGIGELELELKQGNAADMLALAQQLATVEGLRLGSQSKAARGYRLLSGAVPDELTEMSVLVPPAKITVEQGLEACLEWALSQWQEYEERWFEGNTKAQKLILRSLTAIRQILTVFGGIIPRKATAPLRERLSELEELLGTKCSADAFCYRPDYLQLKLALMAWMMNKGWRMFVDNKSKDKLSGSFKRFADVTMSRCLSELKESFTKPLTSDGYSDRQVRLEKQIISFYMLAGAYEQSHSLPFIHGWLRLLEPQGDRDALRRAALEQPPFWLNSGQHI
ncbi:inorganic triphosphatase [Budvicia diplopodorum]|uniref:CYTH domain-containing protein n=1 Tax=Budvicia diplopodorum TaxID=1119056 RepID=UPI00135A906E|nr:inorganic triphosphatase [Budvicia diplopodorum]